MKLLDILESEFDDDPSDPNVDQKIQGTQYFLKKMFKPFMIKTTVDLPIAYRTKINDLKAKNKQILLKHKHECAQYPNTAYLYAKHIINGMFPEGEPAIATSANFSYFYAKAVLGRRFKEGERVIAAASNFKRNYEDLFRISLPSIAGYKLLDK